MNQLFAKPPVAHSRVFKLQCDDALRLKLSGALSTPMRVSIPQRGRTQQPRPTGAPPQVSGTPGERPVQRQCGPSGWRQFSPALPTPMRFSEHQGGLVHQPGPIGAPSQVSVTLQK